MPFKSYILLSIVAIFVSANAYSQTEPDFYGTDIFFHEWNETDHIKDGYDWSMPNWVTPAENGAIVSSREIGAFDFTRKDVLYPDKGHRGQFKRKVNWNWRKLEPTEGVYDFQALRDEIKTISEDGKYKVEVNIYAAVQKLEFLNDDGSVDTTLNNFQKNAIDDETSAPKWLVTDYDVPVLQPAIEGNVRITNLDEFNTEYHLRYIKLINELGKSNILKNPLILNAYVCLGSPTRGEEGEGPALGDDDYPKYLERLDAWANAAGSNKKILMSVASNENNVQEAIDRGMGQRSGFVEQYLIRLTNAQIGSKVNAQGYLEFDENTLIYKEERASGDENENYFLDNLAKSRFGEPRSYKHRYRESTLRALQMRRTTIWDEWAEGFVNPPLSQFASLSLAKRVNTTADAWCYLRQSNMNRNNPNNQGLLNVIATESENADGSLPVKNFERWLYQRDDKVIKTIPTLERGQGGEILFRDLRYPFDYTARKTDKNNGFSRIGFAVDDRFASGNDTDVAIKVSYFDNGSSSWYLSYTNTSGQEVRKNITNTGSDIIKTATWIISDIALNATGMENDFFLVADSGDLTASFVRIVKLNAADGALVVPDTKDGASKINGPNLIVPGNTYPVELTYSASENRNVVVELKLSDDPFTSYGYKKAIVSKGSGTITVDVDIAEDAPLGIDNYTWVGYTVAEGAAFEDNLGVVREEGVDASSSKIDLSGSFRLENKETGQWVSPLCRFVYDESVPLIVSSTENTGSCTKFNFIAAGEGYYYIENVYTKGRFRPKDCATLADDSVEIVQVGDDATGWCVQWQLIDNGDGLFRIQNRETGHFIKSQRCSDQEGTKITQVDTSFDGDCTLWNLIDGNAETMALKSTLTELHPVRLYPVPATDRLFMDTSGASSAIVNLRIYDIQGRELRSMSVKNPITEEHQGISIESLGKGIYILTIDFAGGAQQNTRFTIE